MLIGIPAGSPVKVATRHSPCDSPAVSKRNIYMTFMVANERIRAREANGIIEQANLGVYITYSA